MTFRSEHDDHDDKTNKVKEPVEYSQNEVDQNPNTFLLQHLNHFSFETFVDVITNLLKA